jgi:RHS repeat-associated protein
MRNPFVAGNISGIFVSKISDVAYTVPEKNNFISRLGMKRYELVNHLGNVQAVISDRALPVRVSPQVPAVSHYQADLLSATDYYPFGMVMAGRSLNTDDYHYGFNGKEFDQDWDGGGATYDYGFRIYDPRMCRFLSVDPLTDNYPWYTPYQFAGNTPIWAIDLDGLEEWKTNDGSTVYGPYANQEAAEGVKEIVLETVTIEADRVPEYLRFANPDGTLKTKPINFNTHVLGNSGEIDLVINASSGFDPNGVITDNSPKKEEETLYDVMDKWQSTLPGGVVKRPYRPRGNKARKAIKEDTKERIKQAKSSGSIKNARRNYGLIYGKINGVSVNSDLQMSGTIPQKTVFKAREAKGSGGNSWLRHVDSEYILLNNLTIRLGAKNRGDVLPNVKGRIILISDYPFCSACDRTIAEFMIMFPNVQVIPLELKE